MKQTRLFCRDCKREWLEPRANYTNSSPASITGNPPTADNCPVCGSSAIILVEYNNEPGLDIPRDKHGMPIPIGFDKPKPIEVKPIEPSPVLQFELEYES